MFLREVKRENRNGTQVSYLHLAHSEWDPVAGRSVPKILYGFGRDDQLDRDAIKRLVGSLTRLLDPADAQAADRGCGAERSASPARSGGTFALDALWRRLGIDTVLQGLDTGPDSTPRRGRPRDTAVTERVLFGLVANRALAPSSKLAAADWINHDVHIDGLPETSDDACYRAMDWLHDVREQLERGVFSPGREPAQPRGRPAVLRHHLHLLRTGRPRRTRGPRRTRPPPARPPRRQRGRGRRRRAATRTTANRVGFRTYGKSKDSRDDLPADRDRDGGDPRRDPGAGVVLARQHRTTQALIRQVKDDMRDWTLSRIVWVADRGFSSEHNRRYLRQGDHAYIIGEKLRSDSPEIKAALSRQGRYTDIAENMRVKEVKVSETERFVICHNPDAATRDAAHPRAAGRPARAS